MKFSKGDFIPRLQDAGLDEVILTAFASSITLEALTEAVNNATTWQLSEADVVFYIGERGGLGLTVTGGSVPTPTPRCVAPAGIGSAEWGVWFSTPDAGTEVVRWYVNGTLVLRREQDLTTNRSITVEELGAQTGDVVQVCIEVGNVVGWWGRGVMP